MIIEEQEKSNRRGTEEQQLLYSVRLTTFFFFHHYHHLVVVLHSPLFISFLSTANNQIDAQQSHNQFIFTICFQVYHFNLSLFVCQLK